MRRIADDAFARCEQLEELKIPEFCTVGKDAIWIDETEVPETDRLYKGVFWVVNGRILSEKTECDSTGRAVSSLENGEFPSMREAWDRMPKSRTCGKNYRFFPSGKVDIRNNLAIICIRPKCRDNNIFSLIAKEFGLNNFAGEIVSMRRFYGAADEDT